MNKTLSILFYTRNTKMNPSTGEVPIYLRITVDGKRAEISLNRSIPPSRWNSKAGKAIGTIEASKELNNYIDSYRSKVLKHQQILMSSDAEITAISIKNSILGLKEKGKSLVQIMEYHNEQMKTLIGKEFALSTYKKFETTLMHLIEFMKYKYKVNDLDIKQIDYLFITDFEFFLRTEKNIENNTTVRYLGNLKKVIRNAFANGWLEKDPFLRYKGKIRHVEKYFLDSDEIERLINKTFTIERLSQVRDVFVFSCFTGLAYVDASKLTREHIVKGIDGDDWISIFRTKTKIKCRIPILPEAKRILEKYSNHPACVSSGKLLPILSNQKMNAYLKEIADVCGITKNLTFHISRHSFATTITLANNVPLESVSKMLGHSNTTQTEHYAKILDQKLSDDMAQLRVRYAETK